MAVRMLAAPDINNLIRIDTKDKKFSVVAKRKNVAALINLSKLSATEFIGYVPRQEEDSIVTEIEKYDGKTGQRKTILKNEFFYQGGEQNSRGTVLEVACAADGKIYGLGRQKKNGEVTATFTPTMAMGNYSPKRRRRRSVKKLAPRCTWILSATCWS